MTFDLRLDNKPFLGLHADDAAALAYVQSEKQDTNSDGTGQVPDGAWYVSTDDDAPRIRRAGTWHTFATKEAFFEPQYGAPFGNYRVRSVSKTGDYNFNFRAPYDLAQVVSLVLVVIVPGAAAQAGSDIDLFSEYGAAGEVYNNHSESDTTTLYDLSGLSGAIHEIDISGVFSSLAAGDYAGLNVDHNNLGGTIHYLGIRLRYR